MTNRYVTPDEAAYYLSLSKSALSKMRHRGDGPRYSKIGGRIRYAIADLDAFVEANSATSTSE